MKSAILEVERLPRESVSNNIYIEGVGIMKAFIITHGLLTPWALAARVLLIFFAVELNINIEDVTQSISAGHVRYDHKVVDIPARVSHEELHQADDAGR